MCELIEGCTFDQADRGALKRSDSAPIGVGRFSGTGSGFNCSRP